MMLYGVYFDYPWLLTLAIVLPVLVILLVRYNYRQRAARLARLGSSDVVARLVPPNAMRAPGWRVARLATAAFGVGIAVAGPRWGAERNVVRTSGIDMVLALDASLSMMATDDRPNRLERMKQEVRRLLDQSRGDRTGLIAFAGRSYILTPMTVDGGALALFLDNLDPSVVGQAGSSLARAIRQGSDLLMLSNSGADKALVVMSDGEAFEDVNDVIAEAKHAGDQGISLVTVGFGTTQGSTIPVKNPDGSTTQKRDEGGQIVVTHYTPDFLRAAADAAHGTFIDASRTDKAALVKSALARLRTKARATVSGDSRTPRYQLFLLPAVFLLLLDTILSERRGRRQRRSAASQTAVTAATALVFIVLPFLSGCAGFLPSSSPSDKAARAFHSQNYQQSAALYRSAIDGGDKRPETLYNYGTALLAGDSLQNAIEALERLADAPDPELRYRALFNLGLAQLKDGLAAPKETAAEPLDAALAAYKKVLLMRSNDLDAKWNYELALRKREHGGGGGGGSGGGQSNTSPQEQKPQPTGGLGQQQADQLLGSAAREERDVQAKKQKQTRVEPPPGGKDW
ncbi:MAG TPA: VWA domain-containing protein [Gemmatimonadaceae bacterium]|jgi:Ca-activated chloride channel family protein|nr:VWA domain-containing protein [Gemmatimonadaceae bacterium]